MITRTIKIYGLFDPRDGIIQYVGRTVRAPSDRLRGHLATALKRQMHYPVCRWIRTLNEAGIVPGMRILERVTESEASAAEQRWIDSCASVNPVLNRWPAAFSVELIDIRRGEDAISAKMNDAKVREMRQLRADGATVVELAAQFALNVATVSRICRGESWTHLDGPLTTDRRSNQRYVGEAHPMRKLSAKQVRDIRERYAMGDMSQSALGREYGVTQSLIWHIVRGKNWIEETGPRRSEPDYARGERSPNAKLTEDAVREIRVLFAAGLTAKEIATRFQISDTSIRDILKGRSWRHVQD